MGRLFGQLVDTENTKNELPQNQSQYWTPTPERAPYDLSKPPEQVGGVYLPPAEGEVEARQKQYTKEIKEGMAPRGFFDKIRRKILMLPEKPPLPDELVDVVAAGDLVRFMRGFTMFGAVDAALETMPEEYRYFWEKAEEVSKLYSEDPMELVGGALSPVGAVAKPIQFAGKLAKTKGALTSANVVKRVWKETLKKPPGVLATSLAVGAGVGMEEDSVKAGAMAAMGAAILGGGARLVLRKMPVVGEQASGVETLALAPERQADVNREIIRIMQDPEKFRAFRKDPRSFLREWANRINLRGKPSKWAGAGHEAAAEVGAFMEELGGDLNRMAVENLRVTSRARNTLGKWLGAFENKIYTGKAKSVPLAGGRQLVKDLTESMEEFVPGTAGKRAGTVAKGAGGTMQMEGVEGGRALIALRLLRQNIDKQTGAIPAHIVIRAKRILRSASGFTDEMTGEAISKSEGFNRTMWKTIDDWLQDASKGAPAEIGEYLAASRKYHQVRMNIDRFGSHFAGSETSPGKTILRLKKDKMRAAKFKDNIDEMGRSGMTGDKTVDDAILGDFKVQAAEDLYYAELGQVTEILKNIDTPNGFLKAIQSMDMDTTLSPVLWRATAQMPKFRQALQEIQDIKIAMKYFDVVSRAGQAGSPPMVRLGASPTSGIKASIMQAFKGGRSPEEKLAQDILDRPVLFKMKQTLAALRRSFEGIEPLVENNPIINAVFKNVFPGKVGELGPYSPKLVGAFMATEEGPEGVQPRYEKAKSVLDTFVKMYAKEHGLSFDLMTEKAAAAKEAAAAVKRGEMSPEEYAAEKESGFGAFMPAR